MSERIKATAGTSAVTAGNQISFSLHPKLFEGGRKPIVSIHGLAGAETATTWVKSGGAWKEMGTTGDFTATREAVTFEAPGIYGLTKSATVAAVTLRVHDQR